MPKQFQYFSPADEKGPRFQCLLHKLQCEHINATTGHRCRRFQIIGAVLCWQHLETDRHLRIQKSTVPHGGLGLFAFNGAGDDAIVFSGPRKTRYGYTPGDFIIEYTGETLSNAAVNQRYRRKDTAPYAARIDKHFIEDAACLRSAGSLANHKPHSRANARLVSNGAVIQLVATKNIRNGAEIFIDYGGEYHLGDEGAEYRHRTRNVR